ncbi:MAG: hypothetical protein AAGE94_24550 [Acidobacteriota bacterium]
MTDVSSIGPQWPPCITSHGRVKGIDTRGAILDSRRLDRFLDEIQAVWREQVEPDDQAADRLSVRALIADPLLGDERLARWGEALIPLDGAGDDVDGLSLVYLGRNTAARRSDETDIERSFEHLAIAESREVRSAASVRARMVEEGFSQSILGHAERHGDADVLAGVAALYDRFGWNLDEVRDILAADDSLIAVGRSTRGTIVSAGIAEMSHLRFDDGRELRIAEFTEAATRDDQRAKGLYSGLCTMLMDELARLSRAGEFLGGALDVAFGESSGHDIGIMIAARNLGRTFSRHVGKARGLSFRGFLPQHVPIAGAPRSTPYNDLFPTFLTLADLYAFVES